MRIGFSLGSLLTIDEILECTKILSNHKIDSIWVPETWGMDCCPVLSSISQIDKNAKIGTSVMNIYSRTPSLIAMTAATLGTLSNDRFILGLGTSSEAIVENWHGLKFEHPLQRMREYVNIIRDVLSGKKVNYDGGLFHIRNFTLLIRPPKRIIPIYLAAINQKMVDLAWEVGDGVIFYLRPIDELKKTISKMQSIRKLDVSCQLITCVDNDADIATRRAKKTIAFYVSVGKIYRDFLSKNGFENETKEIFNEYGKSGLENNYTLVSDSMVNSLAICGTPNDVSKKIKRFVETGIDLPILQFNPISDTLKSFNLLISSLDGVIN